MKSRGGGTLTSTFFVFCFSVFCLEYHTRWRVHPTLHARTRRTRTRVLYDLVFHMSLNLQTLLLFFFKYHRSFHTLAILCTHDT